MAPFQYLIWHIRRPTNPQIFVTLTFLMIFHLLGQIKIHDNDENMFCTQVKSTLQHFGRIVKTVKYLKKY